MADIEFFFDPLCPWAWITSRFTLEVVAQRDLQVQWRFISLHLVNADGYAADDKAVAEGRDPERPSWYRPSTEYSHGLLRVAAAIDDRFGNEATLRFYTACGNLIHKGGKKLPITDDPDSVDVLAVALADAGFDAELVDEARNEVWDKVLASDTETALARTGRDVGTPIITFDTSRPDEASLFGPVISRIPRGEEALRLWDAVETIARTPGIAEFKRSLRSEPVFD